MLNIKHITPIDIYSEMWHLFRLGKCTSSKVSVICGRDGFGKGGYSYVYQKVGEALTGKRNEKELDFDEDIEWGKLYEPESLRVFSKKMGIDFLVTQKVISDPESMFSSTPDGIWVVNKNTLAEDSYNVSTVEGKCPRTYHNFIPKFLCNTPGDLYKISKENYWQVIDQMQQAGSTKGYFYVYHPDFPEGSNMKIIEFSRIEMWNEFKFLAERKKEYTTIFNRVLNEMRAKVYPVLT